MFSKAPILALPMMVLAAAVAGCGVAVAQQAERCSGTLCDLYYKNAPAPAQPAPTQQAVPGVPAGATPMTVPSGNFFTGLFSHNDAQQAASGSAAAQQGQAQSSSFLPGVHMGGGGILGDHSQAQCEGTLCDLMGRSTPPREQAPAASEQVAVTTPQPPAGSVAYSSPSKRYAPIEEEEKPRCKSGGDPWHCYRK